MCVCAAGCRLYVCVVQWGAGAPLVAAAVDPEALLVMQRVAGEHDIAGHHLRLPRLLLVGLLRLLLGVGVLLGLLALLALPLLLVLLLAVLVAAALALALAAALLALATALLAAARGGSRLGPQR